MIMTQQSRAQGVQGLQALDQQVVRRQLRQPCSAQERLNIGFKAAQQPCSAGTKAVK